MPTIIPILSLAFGAVLVPSASFQVAKPGSTVAPDVRLTRQDGSTVKLSECRDRKTVVLLFMRGFTGEFACFFCAGQTRDYKASYAKLAAAGAEVWMILPGAKDSRGYLEQVGKSDPEHPIAPFEVPFPVLLDTDFSACRAFGVPYDPKTPDGSFPVSAPATIVVGKDGTILHAYHGQDPGDRPTADSILDVVRGASPAPASRTTSVPPASSGEERPSLDWQSYENGVQAARARKLPVLLEFYADW